jgi:hypothetical protein
MKRRDVFRSGLVAAGSVAAAQAAPQAAKAPAAASVFQPQFFDAHENETIIILSDLIIPDTDTPGAKAAKVNEHMDRIMAEIPEAEGNRFLEGLAWLDGYSRRETGKPFRMATNAQQIAMLKTLDTTKDDALSPGANFFRAAKGWTSRIYFNTAMGYNELNKRGVPKSFAC